MTAQGITVETEPVRRCREAHEAFAAGQTVGAQLARTDFFEYDLITGMVDTLGPQDMQVYGTQSRIDTVAY
jgi:hypothetical protein